MRIYVYKLVHDTGFAPNPFHGWCTLACCKPKIRAVAAEGDWVLGVTPKRLGERLAYFMRVDKVLALAEYFRDPRFEPKKPTKGRALEQCGDNCYEPISPVDFRQLWSAHSNGALEDPVLKRVDLSGKNVLLSRHFGYFGDRPVPIDAALGFMIPGRGHRVNFTPVEQDAILAFLEDQPRGRLGMPRDWPRDDDSWLQRSKCG